MADGDCPAPPEPCLHAVCFEGGCRTENTTAGVVPKAQPAGDCAQLVCDGRGAAVSRQDSSDTPADDGNDCTDEVCEADGPQHTPLALGAACGQAGVCNGKGACGVCLPAKVRCAANAAQACGENGQWSPPEACAGGEPVCDEGRCTGIASVALGDRHGCVRLQDGAVRCWGSDRAGQSSGRGRVPSPLSGVSALVLGSHHRCAIGGGNVWCWGANALGQLGDGTRDDRPAPVQVAGLKDAAQIAAGDAHTCARIENGAVVCWGKDDKGQLGASGTPAPNTTEPPHVMSAARPGADKRAIPGHFALIALGGDGSCAIGADGRLSCWGEDPRSPPAIGPGGRPAPKPSGAPPKLKPIAGIKGAQAVAAGGDHACALLQDGTVLCWGDNEKGELGDASAVKHHPPAPVKLAAAAPGPAPAKSAPAKGAPAKGAPPKGAPAKGLLADVVELALGREHTCARTNDGSVLCWGSNEKGQLGDAAAGKERRSPAPVPGIAGAQAIVAGGDRTCALMGDGQVMCWGDNADGALGDGTADPRPAPVAVAW
jgi:alpha-tubulin suppressor-like RCC1 family protein